MTKVTKRDGRQVDFNEEKIVKAILKAFIEVDGDTSEYAYAKAGNIAQYIKKRAEEKGQLSIEEIQDLVENGLMATKRKDVAKAYVKYREKRTKDREKNTDWMQEIFEKLEASNVQNQNANVDEMSFGGRKGEADSVLMKKVALEHFVPGYAAKKHVDNEIYIHDLDSYAVGESNCLSIPFDDILAKGFNTRQMDIRPAGSINSAFQLLAVVFQLQSLQQFGGVAATHVDWTMVPYVRKSFVKHYLDGLKYFCADTKEYNKEELFNLSIEDEFYKKEPAAFRYAMDMTEKETQQAAEGMFHNLN